MQCPLCSSFGCPITKASWDSDGIENAKKTECKRGFNLLVHDSIDSENLAPSEVNRRYNLIYSFLYKKLIKKSRRV